MSHFPTDHHRKFHTLHRHSNHPIHQIKHHLYKVHHHTKNTIRFSALWLSIIVIFLTIFFVKLVPHWKNQAQTNTNIVFPFPTPTPYIEINLRTPEDLPIEKNVCLSSWTNNRDGFYLQNTDFFCVNRSSFISPLYYTSDTYFGIYLKDSEFINPVNYDPEIYSLSTANYSKGGRYYGWYKWPTGKHVITLIVNPTLTPIPTTGPSPTPRPTSSITISITPTPNKDYYYHVYDNTITIAPTLKTPTKSPTKKPTLTPTKVPNTITNISKYWPAFAVGIPIAIMIIRLIL